MILKNAERSKVKLRLNITSPSGFGKTYGALLIAYGLTGNWEKIAVIDSENNSASLYSHLGNFKTLSLEPPYTTERYVQAIHVCEQAHMEVMIIDSATHIWKGQGGLLEYQNALGGRYQDWAKATPLYQNWLNAILQSKSHIITTTRKKQGYNLITEGNKTKVEKAGLEDEIRDGYEYEMTIALEIVNDKHMARASKDRTQLFVGKPEFVITPETGKKILQWCNAGVDTVRDTTTRINDCKTLDELLKLYYNNPPTEPALKTAFSQRRIELEKQQIPSSLTNQKTTANGIYSPNTTQ